LSTRGFPAIFFRAVVRPERDGQPSRWALLAGPTRLGAAQMLLGLAFQTDQPQSLGRMNLGPNDWRNVLRVGDR
jgi:hypothetical protein